MRPITVTVGPLAAASANSIAQSQTLSGAGSLLLNGSAVNAAGVAVLDTPRRVAITSAGNDSGLTFTITGAGRGGAAQSETLAGGNAGAVASALDYLTVSSITTSGATAAGVQAGTNTTASSALVRLDEYATPNLGGQVVIAAGAATWMLEGSFDDPNSPTNPVPLAAMVWLPLQDSTTGQVINVPNAPLFARVTETAGLGALRATLVQYAEVSQILP